ncbi:MAG: hypothetical protein LBE79_01105, partial [Tannerella sp.]|jgi:hypothetical protein|nr:hypothetical protein [Tannerella sp.]
MATAQGLIWRYATNDLDRSDHFFRSIIQASEQVNGFLLLNNPSPVIWTGIAEGNLGRNLLLRDEYEQAIPLLKNRFIDLEDEYNNRMSREGRQARIFKKMTGLSPNEFRNNIS